MTPKEIRKSILDYLYENRADFSVNTEKLKKELKISEKELDQEIRYLEEKGLVKIMGNYCGKEFLNFVGLKITAYGVDLVEDPEEYKKLFSIKINANTFGNINNSNVNIDSSNIQQMIKNEADENLKLKLRELEEAIKNKDKSKIIETLQYIGDKSLDLLVNIVAGSLK